MNTKKQKTLLTSLSVVVLILLVIFLGLFYFNHQDHKVIVTHKDSLSKMSSKNNPVADLTIKEATGLAIEYAHLKYSNNQNWNEIYQNSLVGTLEVDRYQEYKFENYTVQPKNSQSLYIINKEGALTFSNDKRPGQGSVTFGDTQQELGHVNVKAVYTTVKKQGKLSIAKKISENMNLETQMVTQSDKQSSSQAQQSLQSHASREQSKPNNDNGNLQPISISSKLQGTWYAAGLFASKLGDRVQITNNAVDGKTIYKVKKMPNSEKGLNEFRKKYYGKLIGESTPDGVSYIPAQNYGIDTQNYSVDTIYGVQYLMSGSTGPAGIFFKNPTDAARFTNKYKNHNDELMKKLEM